MQENISRRDFLKTTSIVTASALLSANGFTNPLFAQDEITIRTNKNKALVYLILGGGNDSFNMLVPTNDTSYNEYKTSRSNLALEKDSLLALNDFKDKNNKTFGLHPSMPEVQKLFNDKKLSFVANIGPLVEPTTKEAFKAGNAKLPLGLMSHADQFNHWQTSLPDQRINKGWFGKFADEIQKNKPAEQISMNISLGGTNILQLGDNAREYSITKDGSVGLVINENNTPLNQEVFKAFNKILNQNYTDPFDKTFMDITKEAQTHHEKFKLATNKINISTAISDSELSKQFKMVAKSIAAANELNMPKQTFFLHYYGWDHHDELLDNHSKMLKIVSKALGEFNTMLEELNIAENVITFTGSDFGRTLTSNGNGTDHAWGGNTIIMGSDIKGGEVFGEYPDLVLDSDLDIGGGVLIPTTPIDKLFAELALWFGTEQKNLKTILPNIERFHNLSSTTAPLGLVKNLQITPAPIETPDGNQTTPIDNNLTIELEQGWNLLGAQNQDIDVNQTFGNKDSIRIIWGYDNKTKKWSAFTTDPALLDKIKAKDISILKTIPSKKGYWVYQK